MSKARTWSVIVVLGGMFLCLKLWANPSPLLVQGIHRPQHLKFILHWKGTIPYQVEQSGLETLIVFDRESPFEEKGLFPLPNFVKTLETKIIEGSLITRIHLKETAELKYAWDSEGNFTVDIYNNPLNKKVPLQLPLKHPPTQPNTQHNQKKGAKTKDSKHKTPQKPLPPLIKVSVTGQWKEERPRLILKWEQGVKGVMVHWGNSFMIAFDRPALFDFSQAQTSGVRLFRDLKQLDIKNASVIHLPLPQAYHPSLAREGSHWIIDFSETPPSLPPSPLDVIHMDVQGGDPARVSAISYEVNSEKDLGVPLMIEDPETGYPLSLIPTEGFRPTPENTPCFDILPTVQGIAVLHRLSPLEVTVQENRLNLSTSRELYLTPPQKRSRERDPRALEPLLTFQDLETPYPKKNQDKILKDKEKDLVNKTEKQREPIRIILAKKLLVQGRPKEALGHLDVVIRENPTRLSQASLRALRFLAALLMKNTELATQEINTKALSREPEYPFFKALHCILTHQNLHEAHQTLEDNFSCFESYPSPLRNTLLMMAIGSALANAQDALPYLSRVNQLILTPKDKETYRYYYGKSLEFSQEKDKAREVYKSLETAQDLEIRVKAHLEGIQLALEERPLEGPLQNLTPVIKKLEFLRTLWYGDETELRILDTLGTLYSQQKNYTQALTVLKVAYHALRHLPQTRTLYPKMTQLFAENILDNPQNTPLERVVFYETFKDFIPKGERKHQVHLKLTESYIHLDLLENAEKTLLKILEEESSQDIRQTCSLLLADIYNRDGQFKKALKILKSLESETLPEHLEEKHFRLAFRAFVSLNLYEHAAALIGKVMAHQDTTFQRLELAWARKEWGTAQKLLETLLYGSQDRSTQNSDKDSDQGSEKTSEPPPEQNPAQDKAKNSKQDSQKDPQKTPERPKTSEKFSSPEQKQGHKAAPDPVLVLNCAIASFFNEDESALNRLRDTFRGVMNQTPQGKAFDLLTRQEEAFYPSKVALASKLSDLKTFEDFLKDIQKDSL